MALIIDDLTAIVVLIGDERPVGEVLGLCQDRQALEWASLEFIPDLRVEDAFCHDLAIGRGSREAGDLAEERRAIAIAAANLDAVLFVIELAALDIFGQARQRDRL